MAIANKKPVSDSDFERYFKGEGKSIWESARDQITPKYDSGKPPKVYPPNIARLAIVALFVIGILGSANIMTNLEMGATAAGLGGGSFCLSLMGKNVKNRKDELLPLFLVTLVSVTLGGLGCSNIITASQVGIGVVGIIASMAPLSSCISCAIYRPIKREIFAQAKLDYAKMEAKSTEEKKA